MMAVEGNAARQNTQSLMTLLPQGQMQVLHPLQVVP